MADIVSKQVRSRMMSGIKSVNTKPERTIRHEFHRRGYRYRLHKKEIAGRPDITFASRQAVIFVNGCFWHGHNCVYFRMPKSRTEFWKRKIASNQARDKKVREQLSVSGWRQLVVWECAIRGKDRRKIDLVIDRAERWLNSTSRYREIRDQA